MDFVIPVALGELLPEMDILTAAKLNRPRAKALPSPKLHALGIPRGFLDEIFLIGVPNVVFQRCRWVSLPSETGGAVVVAGCRVAGIGQGSSKV